MVTVWVKPSAVFSVLAGPFLKWRLAVTPSMVTVWVKPSAVFSVLAVPFLPPSHGAGVAVGGLGHVHGVLEAGDGGLGVLAEGDGVVEDLVSSRGLDGEGVARARVLQHWHRSRHLGGQ